MTVEVLLDTPEITVIGTPATVEVLVDYGATGPRGSQIFSGIDNPNSAAPSATLYVNDIYIMKPAGGDLGGIYQYLSDGIGGYQWYKINDFNPTAWQYGQTIQSKTDDYSLIASDAGTLIQVTKATAVTVTVTATTGFGPGQRVDLVQTGAGQVTVSASGVTLYYTPTPKFRSQFSGVTIICLSSGVYWLTGDLAAV